MEERDKKTELLVGLFLAVGFMLLGLLILQFGSIRDLFKNTYGITVTLPDGSGIKEGSPVMLGGSRIGKVKETPRLNANFNGVIIQLEIHNTAKIPADSKFGLGTAGMLGDVFIEIKTSGLATQNYLQAGAQVEGGKAGGLSALGDSAEMIAKKVNATLEDLSVTLKRINEGALSEAGSKDMKDSIGHLKSMLQRLDEDALGVKSNADIKETIANLKAASKSLDDEIKHIGAALDKLQPALNKVDSVITKADTAMVTANTTMLDADKAMKSIGVAADEYAKVAKLLSKGKGDGMLPALLHDSELKNEFTMLIKNMRQHGILWYKDRASEEEKEAPVRPPLTGTRR
jgi:ABC-type transporter Mla subunit MlaD